MSDLDSTYRVLLRKSQVPAFTSHPIGPRHEELESGPGFGVFEEGERVNVGKRGEQHPTWPRHGEMRRELSSFWAGGVPDAHKRRVAECVPKWVRYVMRMRYVSLLHQDY